MKQETSVFVCIWSDSLVQHIPVYLLHSRLALVLHLPQLPVQPAHLLLQPHDLALSWPLTLQRLIAAGPLSAQLWLQLLGNNHKYAGWTHFIEWNLIRRQISCQSLVLSINIYWHSKRITNLIFIQCFAIKITLTLLSCTKNVQILKQQLCTKMETPNTQY